MNINSVETAKRIAKWWTSSMYAPIAKKISTGGQQELGIMRKMIYAEALEEKRRMTESQAALFEERLASEILDTGITNIWMDYTPHPVIQVALDAASLHHSILPLKAATGVNDAGKLVAHLAEKAGIALTKND